MPLQSAVTVRAPLLAGHRPELERLLHEVREHGALIPFGGLSGTHFARFFVLDGFTRASGDQVPDSLVYLADVDGSVTGHLADLARRAPSGVDALFGHCTGYPADPEADERADWLGRHTLRPAAYYRHRAGRTVAQIRGEAALRDELAGLADQVPSTASSDPAALRRSLLTQLLDRPGWAWATRPAPGPGLRATLRETGHAVAVPLLALPLLPVLLPMVLLDLLAIRVKEQTDRPESGPADPAHVAAVEAYEDVYAQNAFTAAGPVKPGLVRRSTMRAGLFGLDYACRHVFARRQLAGVRTIHFARWQPLDDGERVLFASSYDGSQESYMDDFINRLSWGVNLIFSNGAGYPRTRWLVLRGARDEVAYKQYLRKHQIPTVVFHSAYDQLPARTIDDHSDLRDGVARALDAGESAAWLRLL